MKMKRKIIEIDEEKCDGCGLCIPSCPEGALQIVETAAGPRARLVKENFCDGLGACLGECPQGALRVEEREVEPYNEEGVIEHLKAVAPGQLEEHLRHLEAHAAATRPRAGAKGGFACPSARTQQWRAEEDGSGSSMLGQWPVQLHLVSPEAPCFKGADVLLVADCVPIAYRNFHADFLKGKAIAVACPKLDDTEPYVEKLTRIIRSGKPRSLTVLHMEVPCCSGLLAIASEAVAASGCSVPLRGVMIGLRGEILRDGEVDVRSSPGSLPARPGRRIPRGNA